MVKLNIAAKIEGATFSVNRSFAFTLDLTTSIFSIVCVLILTQLSNTSAPLLGLGIVGLLKF